MIRTQTPMTEPYLATLNPEQCRAVEYSGDQPLLIIAGAGSGKTNTLAHRVARPKTVPIGARLKQMWR